MVVLGGGPVSYERSTPVEPMEVREGREEEGRGKENRLHNRGNNFARRVDLTCTRIELGKGPFPNEHQQRALCGARNLSERSE